MYHFKDDISAADDIIYVKCSLSKEAEEQIKNYEFRRLVFDPPHTPPPFRPEYHNMAYLMSWSPDSKDMVCCRKIIDEYNAYINYLEQLDGFREFFIDHQLSVSKKEVAENWSQEVVDRIFALEDSVFATDLFVLNDYLFDVKHPQHYEASLNGTNVVLPLGDYCENYPKKAGDKSLIWNWVENGNDFCYTLWLYLGAPDSVDDNTDFEDNDEQVSYYYDYYEEWRNDVIRYPQLVRIFKKLESMGYLHSYTLLPEHKDAWWYEYGKIDGGIDVAVIDDSFRRNKLLMEQIELFLWSPEKDIQEKPYILTNAHNEQFLSSEPGKLGGHRKLKIYGRLDCPSANRYVKKGQYIRNRVFFEDEKTAILAGFRPCGVCMPEEYKKWKEKKSSE